MPAAMNDRVEMPQVVSRMWRLSRANTLEIGSMWSRGAVRWRQHQRSKLYPKAARCLSKAMLNAAAAWRPAMMTSEGGSMSIGGTIRAKRHKALRRKGFCCDTDEATSMVILMMPMRTAHVATEGEADKCTERFLGMSYLVVRRRIREEQHKATSKRSQWHMNGGAVMSKGNN